MTIDLELTYTPAQIQIFFPEKEAKYTIVPKGRRFGATKGAANAMLEWACEGITPILWVDTVNGNIDRYYERYFQSELRKTNLPWKWHTQKRQLNILNSTIDFRSSDHPENIEGFGYKKIFLNEAGIILKDNYLYTNSILPMLLDFPDSQLYAVGTPKGKIKKDGSEHLFYSLFNKAKENFGGQYRWLRYSTYDNPLLSPNDIKDIENEMALMSPATVRQEIYGEYIELESQNPFFSMYDPELHESKEVTYNPDRPIYISMDFNVQPMLIGFAHLWRDREKQYCHFFDEISINNANIDAAGEHILKYYGNKIYSMNITGDHMGTRKDIGQRDNASLYLQLQRKLNLHPKQLLLLPNPTHENSRNDCNYVLKFFPELKINPDKCKNLCRDMRTIQADNEGKIIKKNRHDITQQSDAADMFRYFVNAFLHSWKVQHQKGLIK